MNTMRNHRVYTHTDRPAAEPEPRRLTRRAAKQAARKTLSVFMAVVLSFWAVPANAFAEATGTAPAAPAEQPADDQPANTADTPVETPDPTDAETPGDVTAPTVTPDPAVTVVPEETATPDVATDDQPATPATYTITYKPNMPAEEAAPESRDMPDAVHAADGAEAELPAVTYAREGYAFAGWSTSEDGLQRPGQDVPAAAAADKQRMTDLTYTVEATRIDYADGTSRIVPKAQADALEALAAAGDANVAASYDVTEAFNLADHARDGSITLYAQWVKLPAGDGEEAAPADGQDDGEGAEGEGEDDPAADEEEFQPLLSQEEFEARMQALTGATPRKQQINALGIASLAPQDTTALAITVDAASTSATGLDALRSSGSVDASGNILYNLQADTAQAITLTMGQDLFSGSNTLTVQVTLPSYGFVFEDNLVSDLNAQSQIKDAAFTKDANGKNTTVTFTVDGTDHVSHTVGLKTKYAALTNAQCAAIIQDGWEASTLSVKVTNTEGTELASNNSYSVLPRVNDEPVFTVAKHEWTQSGDIRAINAKSDNYLYAPNQRKGEEDRFSVTMKLAGGTGQTQLVQVQEFKVYVPDERLRLSSISQFTAHDENGDYLMDSYFYLDLSAGKMNDHDGKGSYYLIKPKSPIYNNGTDAGGESVTFTGYLRWYVEDTSGQYLDEGGKTYQASNVLLDYLTPGKISKADSGPGSCFHTYPVRYDASYGFSQSSSYMKQYSATTGAYTSPTQVAPGQKLKNQWLLGVYVANGIRSGYEYRGPYGDVTEVYSFPYEVRPSEIVLPLRSGLSYGALNVIDSITYTVRHPDGSETLYTVDSPARNGNYFKSGWNSTVTYSLLKGVGQGDRVAEVVVHRTSISGTSTAPISVEFNFQITETHENGTALQNGEFLQVHCKGTWNDEGYRGTKDFDTTASGQSERYFYLQVAEKDCPWAVLRKVNSNRAADSQGNEVFKFADVGLEGVYGKTRDYLENPVYSLEMTASDINGASNNFSWLSFLTGNMTLTRNLAGWKIRYTVYDEVKGTTRKDGYDIPSDLSGDMRLTREMLRIGDNEAFTSFEFYYDGKAKVADWVEYNSTNENGPGGGKGLFMVSWLAKDLEVKVRAKDFENNHLDAGVTFGKEGSFRLATRLAHAGSCNRAGHTNGNGEQSYVLTGPGRDISMQLYTDYEYDIAGPNFGVEPKSDSAHQGGTIVFDLAFRLQYTGKKLEQTGSTMGWWLPADVPEAIYIELKDKYVDLDVSDPAFLASLAEHGMSANDVSIIEKDDRRWVKLTTGSANVAWRTKLKWVPSGRSETMNFPFSIALRVWDGHELGVTQPFGDVYYDLSQYLVKYGTGTEANQYQAVSFQGAVADTEGLLGDNDTTTKRLWYGNASTQSFTVLPNYSTGAVVYPGKHDTVYREEPMSYTTADRQHMFASATINSPDQQTTYDYETVFQLPTANTDYSWMQEGEKRTGRSETTLLLTGPAKLERSTLDVVSDITFTYSKDGTDGSYKTAEQVAGDWNEYRFVKVTVPTMPGQKSLGIRFPVTTNETTEASKVSYLGGSWTFASSSGGTKQSPPTAMKPAIYVMAPTVDIPVTKHLKAPANAVSGGTYDHSYGFDENAFSFRIEAVDGAPLTSGTTAGVSKATVTTGTDGTQTQVGGVATFTGLEFDSPGTYTYRIHEVIPDGAVNNKKDGVVYSDRTAQVKVVVTRDASTGKLSAQVQYDSGTTGIEFTNVYEVQRALVQFGGTKTLTDKNTHAALPASGYSFCLEEPTGEGGAFVRKYDTALVSGTGGAANTFTFTELEFTQLDWDAGKELKYRIHEIIPADATCVDHGVAYGNPDDPDHPESTHVGHTFAKDGVIYDQTMYEATVTLSADKGVLTPTVTYKKIRDASGNAVTSGNTVNEVAFNNKYEAKGSAKIQVEKDLAGREWKSDDSFTFKIEAVGGTDKDNNSIEAAAVPMPKNSVGAVVDTVSATRTKQEVQFGEIAYPHTSAGSTYEYKVTEVKPAEGDKEANMRYSEAEYRVKVAVAASDDGKGTYPTTVTYELKVPNSTTYIEAGDEATFLNKSVGHGTATIFAEKRLTGRDWLESDRFEFELVADHAEKDGATVQGKTIPMPSNAVATATSSARSAAFPAIQYTYSDDDGYTYYYKVKEKNTGASGVTYDTTEREVRVVVGHESMAADTVTATVEYKVGDNAWVTTPTAVFNNSYSAEPATAQVKTQKLLKAPGHLLGSGTYDRAYAFDEGAYSFTLTPGVDAHGNKSPMPEGKTSLIASADAGAVDDDGKPSGGYATFKEITFTEPGTYNYVITENPPADVEADSNGVYVKDGVTYTNASHNATVVVTDDGSGQLEAEVQYQGDLNHPTDKPVTFTNLYNVQPVELTISGSKTINGLVPGAGYEFELHRTGGKNADPSQYQVKRYADSAADGTFSFQPIVYPQVAIGDFPTYVVTEVVPDDAVNSAFKKWEACNEVERAAGGFKKDGIEYDASAFKIVVDVADAGKGTMTATPTIYRIRDFDGKGLATPQKVSGIEFQNRITPAGTATLTLSKELFGRDWHDSDAFTFKAEDATAEVVAQYQESAADVDPNDPTGATASPLYGLTFNTEVDAPAGVIATATKANHEKVEFGKLNFMPEHAGLSFVYRITEEAGSEEGMSYDPTQYYALVTATSNGDGTVSVDVSYYRGSVVAGNQVDEPDFVNYQGLVPCKHDPPVRKVVEGSPASPGKFTFTMTRDDPSFPMMTGAEGDTKTVVQTGAGAVEFGEITFTRPGTYTYTVREAAGTDSAYSYDSSVWTVRYDVTIGDEQVLHAERTFLKDGEEVPNMEAATFTNVYTPPSTPSNGKPNVTLEKSQDKTSVQTGDEITYTLVATNNGDAVARGLYVKDYVPAGTSFVRCGGHGNGRYGASLEGEEFATWFVEELAPGESATMTLTVRVNECRAGDRFRNVAAWELTGGSDRPSPNHDPDPMAGDKSNPVEASVPGGPRVRPAVRHLPQTSDPLMPLAMSCVVTAMLAAAVALQSGRRRKE